MNDEIIYRAKKNIVLAAIAGILMLILGVYMLYQTFQNYIAGGLSNDFYAYLLADAMIFFFVYKSFQTIFINVSLTKQGILIEFGKNSKLIEYDNIVAVEVVCASKFLMPMLKITGKKFRDRIVLFFFDAYEFYQKANEIMDKD